MTATIHRFPARSETDVLTRALAAVAEMSEADKRRFLEALRQDRKAER